MTLQPRYFGMFEDYEYACVSEAWRDGDANEALLLGIHPRAWRFCEGQNFDRMLVSSHEYFYSDRLMTPFGWRCFDVWKVPCPETGLVVVQPVSRAAAPVVLCSLHAARQQVHAEFRLLSGRILATRVLLLKLL